MSTEEKNPKQYSVRKRKQHLDLGPGLRLVLVKLNGALNVAVGDVSGAQTKNKNLVGNPAMSRTLRWKKSVTPGD